MIVSEKKHSELEHKLNSSNKKVVSDAIISLRDEDPFKGAIGLLASYCWQSGLDYSGFAEDFVNVIIRGDYLTSLE